ncbi:hypothetical protein KY314_02775 [Candidatus Woesearchaeota archaeon]|nr:hypothetical protein [Candidatus Woesearchaeota archaeon]
MGILETVKELRENIDPSSIETIQLMERSINEYNKSGVRENIFGTLREDTKLKDCPDRDQILYKVADIYFKVH